MTLKPMPWLLSNHYIVMAMRDVRYPVSRRELMECLGDVMIPTGHETEAPFREILQRLPLDYYRNAAEFFCNISSS